MDQELLCLEPFNAVCIFCPISQAVQGHPKARLPCLTSPFWMEEFLSREVSASVSAPFTLQPKFLIKLKNAVMDSDIWTVRMGKWVLVGWTQEACVLNWAAPVLSYRHLRRTRGELLPWMQHLQNQHVPANRMARTTEQKCHCASQRIKTIGIISPIFLMSFLINLYYPSVLRLCKDRKLGMTQSQSFKPEIQLAGSMENHASEKNEKIPQSLFLK